MFIYQAFLFKCSKISIDKDLYTRIFISSMYILNNLSNLSELYSFKVGLI